MSWRWLPNAICVLRMLLAVPLAVLLVERSYVAALCVLVIAGVSDGLDAVADQYASELSAGGGTTTSRLRVLDVATPADYGRVMSYLEKVSSLQSVDVESLERGTLTVRVAARGDAQVLQRMLALGGVLRPDSAAPAGGALVFRIASAEARP